MTEWSKLPESLWELIFHRLDMLIDRIRFGAVCPLFRSITIAEQPHRLSHTLLLLPQSSETTETREFFNLSDTQIYKSHIPELQGKWCCGSSFGWLCTIDFKSGAISLLNPLSRAQIPLPPLSAFTDPPDLQGEEHARNDIWFIENATLSSSPSKNNDFIVVTKITYLWALAFCKPGFDKWINLPTIKGPCEDVLYYKDKFYVITSSGALITWDLSDIDAPTSTIIIESHDETPFRMYLVESIRGELCKVCRIVQSDDKDSGDDQTFRRTVGMVAFKFDEEEKSWDYGCLCSQALFLGYNSAICVSILGNPEFREHGIYFTDDNPEQYFENPNGCNDVGLYDPRVGSVEKFYGNQLFWTKPCIWITPSLH